LARELRRAQSEVLSQYDATVTRPGAADPENDNAGDPVLDASVGSYTAAFATYAADALDYHTEQPYRVLAARVSRQWNWDSGVRAARWAYPCRHSRTHSWRIPRRGSSSSMAATIS